MQCTLGPFSILSQKIGGKFPKNGSYLGIQKLALRRYQKYRTPILQNQSGKKKTEMEMAGAGHYTGRCLSPNCSSPLPLFTIVLIGITLSFPFKSSHYHYIAAKRLIKKLNPSCRLLPRNLIVLLCLPFLVSLATWSNNKLMMFFSADDDFQP